MIRKVKQKIRNYLTAKYDALYLAELENQVMSYQTWIEEEEASFKEKEEEPPPTPEVLSSILQITPSRFLYSD